MPADPASRRLGDVAQLVAALAAAGYKRETIKKTRDALAMTLDFHKIEPNPARDNRSYSGAMSCGSEPQKEVTLRPSAPIRSASAH